MAALFISCYFPVERSGCHASKGNDL